MKLKNRLWLWGQDAMSHQRALSNATWWKIPDGNTLDPAQGAEYLGIPNMCRVVMCGKPEGIVFCANCCADVGGPAVQWRGNGSKRSVMRNADVKMTGKERIAATMKGLSVDRVPVTPAFMV